MSNLGKADVSPLATAAVIIVVLLAIGVVVGVRLRSPAPSAVQAGSLPPASPAAQKQNQQFLTDLESIPPGRRISYVNKQLDKMQQFMSSATLAQRQQFAQDVKGQ